MWIDNYRYGYRPPKLKCTHCLSRPNRNISNPQNWPWLPVWPFPFPSLFPFYLDFFWQLRQSWLCWWYLSPNWSSQYLLLVIISTSLLGLPSAFNSSTLFLYRHFSRPSWRPMQPHLYWTNPSLHILVEKQGAEINRSDYRYKIVC